MLSPGSTLRSPLLPVSQAFSCPAAVATDHAIEYIQTERAGGGSSIEIPSTDNGGKNIGASFIDHMIGMEMQSIQPGEEYARWGRWAFHGAGLNYNWKKEELKIEREMALRLIAKAAAAVFCVRARFMMLLLRGTSAIMKQNKQWVMDTAGSTLVAAIVQENRFLTIVNVGDSRAVVSDADGMAHAVTVDHKPSDVIRFSSYPIARRRFSSPLFYLSLSVVCVLVKRFFSFHTHTRRGHSSLLLDSLTCVPYGEMSRPTVAFFPSVTRHLWLIKENCQESLFITSHKYWGAIIILDGR